MKFSPSTALHSMCKRTLYSANTHHILVGAEGVADLDVTSFLVNHCNPAGGDQAGHVGLGPAQYQAEVTSLRVVVHTSSCAVVYYCMAGGTIAWLVVTRLDRLGLVLHMIKQINVSTLFLFHCPPCTRLFLRCCVVLQAAKVHSMVINRKGVCNPVEACVFLHLSVQNLSVFASREGY